jgi:hypothetical protein
MSERALSGMVVAATPADARSSLLPKSDARLRVLPGPSFSCDPSRAAVALYDYSKARTQPMRITNNQIATPVLPDSLACVS